MASVADGVHRLGSRYVNWYLVEEGGSFTVVDTGLAGYFDQLLDGLVRVGASIAAIEAVVLTHNHTDHIGFAERLRALGPQVFIHELDAPAATGEEKLLTPTGRPLDLVRPGMGPFLVHALRNGGMGYATVHEVTTFTDGEVLDVPGRPRVVHTPGHSRGHCALSLEERGVLFSGDGIVTGIPWGGRSGPQLMKINVDADEARRSLDIYERLTGELLLSGHGEPWRGDVGAAARSARDRASAPK